MVSLNIKASTDNTGAAMDFIDKELLKYDLAAWLRPEILIAAEEIFVNIATYAYKPAEEGYVKLTVSVENKAKVIIQFEDSGLPFNPLEVKTPDLDAPITERKIGGLGIHYVRNLMDEVRYLYADGMNSLTISKKLS